MKHITRRNELIRFRETRPTRTQWREFVASGHYTSHEIASLNNWIYLGRNRYWRAQYARLRVK